MCSVKMGCEFVQHAMMFAEVFFFVKQAREVAKPAAEPVVRLQPCQKAQQRDRLRTRTR